MIFADSDAELEEEPAAVQSSDDNEDDSADDENDNKELEAQDEDEENMDVEEAPLPDDRNQLQETPERLEISGMVFLSCPMTFFRDQAARSSENYRDCSPTNSMHPTSNYVQRISRAAFSEFMLVGSALLRWY